VSNLIRLPKWAQSLIRENGYQRDRLTVALSKAEAKTVKQSEEIQALLDILRNVRPDLYRRWNEGTPLAQLVKESNP
jgi:hypothetical protein